MNPRTRFADKGRGRRRGLALLAGAMLVAGIIAGSPAWAGDFKMGNYDLSGSRSIPSDEEPALSRAQVKAHGLEVERFLPTDYPVVAVPTVLNGIVYAGDVGFDNFDGYVYAFDANTGELKWKTHTGAIVASPLISGSNIYVGTLAGTLFKLDRKTGAVEASTTPSLRPGFDSIWSGPMKIGEKVIIAINPNDEFPGPLAPGGLGALLALDARTLDEIWRFVPVDNDVDEPPIAGEQYGGAGIWNTQITYSPELGLLFFGTGQNTYSTDGRTPGSDSVFAVNLKDGTLAWQTQTVNGDIWNFNVPFYYNDASNPPRDMDIGDAPAIFWDGPNPYIAVGSKRGYFYIMDARDGSILNGSGRDDHGFLKGLEVLSLPGPSTDGGFNLDGGYFTDDDGRVVHFGTVNDYAGQFDESSDFCYAMGAPACPGHVSYGHLVLIDEEGENELGRWSNPNAAVFTPLHLDGMIVMRETVDLTTFDVDKLIVLDVSDPTNPTPIAGATVDLPNTRSIGAHISISGGLIFTGSGFYSDVFGSPVGLYVIGLGTDAD